MRNLTIVPKTFVLLYCKQGVHLEVYSGLFSDKSRHVGGAVYSDGPEQSLECAISDVVNKYDCSYDDNIYLGLPLSYFSFYDFFLPAMSAKNLQNAVYYHLLNNMPYSLESVYYDYDYETVEKGIEVHTTLALREQMSFLLERFSVSGLSVAAVFPNLLYLSRGKPGIYAYEEIKYFELIEYSGHVQYYVADEFFDESAAVMARGSLSDAFDVVHLWDNSESDKKSKLLEKRVASSTIDKESFGFRIPASIKLLSSSVLKQRKFSHKVLLVSLIVFLIALISTPLARVARNYLAVSNIEDRIERRKSEAKTIRSIENSNTKTMENIKELLLFVNNKPNVNNLLKEITEILPRSCWLESFTYDDKKVVIAGHAKSAAAVLELVENSPLFTNAHFDSQIVARNNLEDFKIVADVEL